MLTFLDYWIAGARESATRLVLPGTNPPQTDLLAAINMCSVVLPEYMDHDSTFSAYKSVVIPHLLQAAGTEIPSSMRRSVFAYPCSAVQVGANLVNTFLRGKVPKSLHKQSTFHDRNWYFDFPGRSLPIDSNTYVRAVFSQPFTGGGALVVAVLTNGRSNSMENRYCWVCRDGEHSSFRASFKSDVSLTDLAELIGRVLTLSVLYKRQREADSASDLPILKRRLDEVPKNGKQVKKLRAKAKTHTLFSVNYLDARNCDGLPSGEQRAGWVLSHRIDVAAHWRAVRFGVGRQSYRLRLIEEYERGPKGAPKKPKLVRI